MKSIKKIIGKLLHGLYADFLKFKDAEPALTFYTVAQIISITMAALFGNLIAALFYYLGSYALSLYWTKKYEKKLDAMQVTGVNTDDFRWNCFGMLLVIYCILLTLGLVTSVLVK